MRAEHAPDPPSRVCLRRVGGRHKASSRPHARRAFDPHNHRANLLRGVRSMVRDHSLHAV